MDEKIIYVKTIAPYFDINLKQDGKVCWRISNPNKFLKWAIKKLYDIKVPSYYNNDAGSYIYRNKEAFLAANYVFIWAGREIEKATREMTKIFNLTNKE